MTKEDVQKLAMYETLLENLPQEIFLKDKNSVYIYGNGSYARKLKIRPDEIAGKTDYDLYSKELAEKHIADDRRIMKSGKPEELEETYLKGGQEITVHKVKGPVKDEEGNIIGTAGISWDVTEHKRSEKALLERDEAIKKLSTPLVEAWEGVVLLPVVGILDSARAKQITESVLQCIARTKADVIVIDISGIAAIDTKSASHILRTVQAVKLMGSEAVITGIRPDVAVTLVTLGIDLSGVVSRSTLREGLEYAYAKLGLKLTKIQ
nr:PAS domain-containing protein [Candidatus Njordarchaeota archaeon]